MNNNIEYTKQVKLLIKVIPEVAKEECFALKGGTAINLFFRDLPRLSVDIDLVYLPLDTRELALSNARKALDRIIERVKSLNINAQHTDTKQDALRIILEENKTRIKLELSPVMRGVVYEPTIRSVTNNVEDQFGYAEILTTSFEDLYAGKICAALDRQHPRDLYDVKLLLENEGISEAMRKAFLVYLISHSRPISEVLKPPLKDNIREKYEAEFRYMTKENISIEVLEDTFHELVKLLNENMTKQERDFLLSFKKKNPDWSLLGLKNIHNLPAVQWKLLNLNKMPDKSYAASVKKLIKVLYPEKSSG